MVHSQTFPPSIVQIRDTYALVSLYGARKARGEPSPIVAWAKVSLQDVELVSDVRWIRSGPYAVSRQLGAMHRLIMDLEPNRFDRSEVCVDHINHDGFDNRRENLRVVTHAENMRNRRPPKLWSGARKWLKAQKVKAQKAEARAASRQAHLEMLAERPPKP